MDDGSQGSHRNRPASSASSYTRMTPSSTNSSTLQLPNTPRTNSMRASGAGLLQERIRERKVETARKERRGSMDLTANMERGSHSSPAKIADHRLLSSGGLNGRGMGVKHVEEQVTSLHKQNFDLKLELYHRRQRQETLEAQLEAAEKQLAEQAELQEVNDQLLAELEKRDAAVEEAVCMIVTLEEKIEKLMDDRNNVIAFETDYEPSYFQDDHDHEALPSSPPQFEGTPRRVPRMPSFLSETTEGADALRSHYLPHNSSYSDAPLPRLLEDGTQDGMNSPRLSVLSESSFLSIYGDKHLSIDESVDTSRRHRASASIEKWVDERPMITPARPTPPIRKNQFLSINDVLDSPLQRLEKLKSTLENNRGQQFSPDRIQEKRYSREVRQLFTTQPSDFGRQHTLPPTPDTISTNTLRHHQNSNDTLADNKNGTYLDLPSNHAIQNAAFNSYPEAQSVRPQSAGETVTSRRDGHGWDTASQDTPTETGSADASITTFASQRFAKTGRVMTPNLFSFSGGRWGKEVMYDHELSLPAHTASQYRDRRSSMVQTPISDGTTVKHSSPSSSSNSNSRYGSSPIDATVPPNLPDRRSSIAATKLRQTRSSTNESQAVAAATPVPAKKSRMPSLRIFGRSETTPVLTTTTTTTTSSVSVNSPSKSRAQSYIDQNSNLRYEDDDDARATPPPIQRTRAVGPPTCYRPSSAAGVRRVSELSAGDGGANGRRSSVSVREGEGGMESEGAGVGGPRKWFGIKGRSGSVRRM